MSQVKVIQTKAQYHYICNEIKIGRRFMTCKSTQDVSPSVRSKVESVHKRNCHILDIYLKQFIRVAKAELPSC